MTEPTADPSPSMTDGLNQRALPQVTAADSETVASLYRAEVAGIKIALIGRTFVLACIIVIVATFGAPPARYEWPAITAVFMLEGLLFYLSVGSRFERRWHKYVFFVGDVVAVATALYFAPLIQTDEPARILMFRTYGPEIFYILVATAALTLSPRLVLQIGAAGAVCWITLFFTVSATVENPISWSALPANPRAADYQALLLHPDFIGTGNRLIEAAGIFLMAVLLFFAAQRARRIVLERVSAERERNKIEGMFGHYVPKEVVDRLVGGDSMISPVRRDATLFYLDTADFTAMTERHTPEEIVEILSGLFDLVGRVLSRHGGTVTNLNGDAVVAAFNVPVDCPDHADCALQAAQEIQAALAETLFLGERLSARIGISSGEIAAGIVGGSGRQTYTVHGNAINLAARLEALNKQYGTQILLSADTFERLKTREGVVRMDQITVRGRTTPVEVYSFAALP